LMKGYISGTIGNTPIVELKTISGMCSVNLAAKLEGCNPGGSIKDRIALGMVESAEREGLIEPGGMIVEPTSGNTGIGLAMVAAARGYELTVTMPESMSIERRKMIAAYGADVVVTPEKLGMKGAVAEAERIVSESKNAFMPMQFTNPVNPRVHMETTGPEIWDDTDGKVDCVVCGVGTGGTITGIGEALKARKPGVRMIAVEPSESAVLSGGEPGSHTIEGIGAGFVPDVLDLAMIDEVVTVSGEEARDAARRLAREEGIFAGMSSGAVLAAALKTAGLSRSDGRTFVLIFADRGDKYISTGLWD